MSVDTLAVPTPEPTAGDPATAILTQLIELRTERRLLAEVSAEIATLHEAFQAQHAAAFADQARLKERVAKLEDFARQLILAAYAITREKKPCAGAEVKMGTVLEYKASEALEWAKRTGMALIPEQLDVTAFVKIAGVTPLTFVNMIEVPKAQLAKDLDKALGGAS